MAIYSLTGNVRSPFHAEPTHWQHVHTSKQITGLNFSIVDVNLDMTNFVHLQVATVHAEGKAVHAEGKIFHVAGDLFAIQDKTLDNKVGVLENQVGVLQTEVKILTNDNLARISTLPHVGMLLGH